MNRIRQVWESLRSSLWFIPTLMVLGAVALAVALIEAESFVNREMLAHDYPRLFGAGAEGARGMLSAIAGSMITVAGVVFSITTVTFALAASQYTSRILRTFMSDRGSQAALGVFLGVFAYCLVVLRTIRGGDEGVFVPTLAVLGAFLLALVAIGVLVYFIHHVASSIQASVIIHSVTGETLNTVDRLHPDRAAGPAAEPLPPEPLRASVPSRKIGYIQALHGESLLRWAREQNTVIRMERRIGDFVFEGLPLHRSPENTRGRSSSSSSTAPAWSDATRPCSRMPATVSARSSTSPSRRSRPASTTPRPRSSAWIISGRYSCAWPDGGWGRLIWPITLEYGCCSVPGATPST